MKAVKKKVKDVLAKGKNFVYHFEHNNSASKVLKRIEAQKGKLDPKNEQLCREYAKDIFGDIKYAPWLYVYSAFSRDFKEGWIPDNYYGEVVVPQLNGEYGRICNRNAAINKLLGDFDSLDIGYYLNKLFLSTGFEVLSEENLKKLLFEHQSTIVYKVENSRQGKGVYFFNEQSFDLELIKKLGNGVFQKYIEQHPFFSQFNNASVATIRLTSVCDDNGHIEAKAGYFRIGRENDTHVISDRQLRTPINIKTGQLHDMAYFPDSKTTKYLPNSNVTFAGKTLPSFDYCLSEITKLHSRIPFVRCVGWDLILDKNNQVKIIELNGGHNGIKFNEMIQGPCFKGLNWEKLHLSK
ncbi:hypothetical protein ES711_15980 [Gelidibacter salicanalis]|uniref:Alpha-L-glutamate ligase-related protein ATP-grasp domain-containing protein n=1 Tax=Gelidibacter salicanalis TaxID=291193 RepID=A0A5C7AC33_9FLAO|nr:sugar-transfer associated ATP-grasp domain-containing protein [Gelidibacter salicanalis]TXE04835.1 hypothetical protein ES711_15980 [Gelidibacter salicanalis]